jgi:hypothetical protein
MSEVTLDSIMRKVRKRRRYVTKSARPRHRRYLEAEDYAAASTAMDNMTKTNTNISYVETDFRDFITNTFIAKCAAEKIDVYCDEVHFDQIDELSEVVMQLLKELGYPRTLFASSSTRAQIVVGDIGIVSVRTNSNSSFVEVLGDKDLVDVILDELRGKYSEITTSIEWMIGGDSSSVTIPLRTPAGVTDSSYPFIEEGVDAFIEDFLKSSENILLLIGEPGTGKSNFIKYIVSRSKQNALITYDPEIMKKDGIFAMFIEGEYGSLIMEDADTFLGARSEGNQMMAKFLNVGDGIVSMASKKLIFSTNLEKLDDIDPALLRPGRCFAVLQFRKMNFDEAKQFLADHKITSWAPTPGESYSLAELYNHTKQARKVTTKRKLGFY